VLLVLGLAGSRGSAQSTADAAVSAKVDSVVEAQQKAQKIPGVSLAVCRDGKIIKASGYGLANVELGVPVTPETIFQTGSVGKQFTAMAVMMLVEEGKLQLDDRMTKYIPEPPSSWQDVTIRQLLTHTSGIADYGGEEGTMGKGVINFRRDYTEGELIQAFAKMPMDFPPGQNWSYSNTGYVLLGIIIHRVTGEFYGDFLQERIFRPLGMTSTRIISEADIVPHRSSGYRLVNGELKNQEWVSPTLNTTADGRSIRMYWIWLNGMPRCTAQNWFSNRVSTRCGHR
jgi:CubicO group peptidase (beta-lactamase class C family)